jgi:hypothetical protein
VKKPVSRHSDRRKNDEDIAERITGGVRVERPAVRHDDQHRTSANQVGNGDRGDMRDRRRTPSQ